MKNRKYYLCTLANSLEKIPEVETNKSVAMSKLLGALFQQMFVRFCTFHFQTKIAMVAYFD